MKKVIRFFAIREFSLIDLAVGTGCVTLFEAGHIAWAFVALIVGAGVSLIAEKATL